MDTLSPHSDNGNIPSTSGIYKITCTVNQRFYIGSAIDLRRRKYEHWYGLRHNKHHNPILQNAWNKYGEQSFTFEVLEQVLPMSLTAREQYWFKKLKPFGLNGFNVLSEAGLTLGRKHSSETVEKIRRAQTGKKQSPEHIEKMRQTKLGKPAHNKGMKHSSETVEKIRRAHLGKKRSPETIEKIRQAKLGNKNALGKNLGNKNALGYKQSPETCEKIRQSKLGKKLVDGKYV